MKSLRIFFSVLGILLVLGLVTLVIVTQNRGESTDTRSQANFGAEQLVWWGGTNLGQASGVPADFRQQFTQPEQWQTTLENIDVMQVGIGYFSNSNSGITDAFIRNQIIPLLQQHNIKLSLETTSVTWGECRPNMAKNISADLAALDRLQGLGLEVSYISLQSVLSKPVPQKHLGNCSDENLTMDERVKTIVEYHQAIKSKYPTIQIGIIDALPTQGKAYREPYAVLQRQLNRAGYALDFIHLDKSFDQASETPGYSWQKIKEVETYVQSELKVPFGLIFTSKSGGDVSNEAFATQLTKQATEYMQIKGQANHIMFMSWFPHPNQLLPDTQRYTFTHTINETIAVLAGKSPPAGNPPPNTKPSNPPPVNIIQTTTLVGNFADIRDNGIAVGYAINTARPTEEVTIEVYLDGNRNNGQLLTSFKTNFERPDLNQRYQTTGLHGFRYTLPSTVRDGQQHQLYIYAISTNGKGERQFIHLENSPQAFKLAPN